MSEFTIAKLPFNPDDSSMTKEGSPVLTNVDMPVLSVVEYTDKTFIVYGEATKTYKTQLRDLGGKFNGHLKERDGFNGGAGWIFMMKFKPEVYKFVNQVNTENINQHNGVPNQDSQNASSDGTEITLPTVIAPIKDATYQYVKWKVFKPVEGMKVTIKAGGASSVGEVIQTETHGNIVDTAYINLGGNTSKLVITNGVWQVLGYMVEHSVFFGEKKSASPSVKVSESHKKKYDYEDIAGI